MRISLRFAAGLAAVLTSCFSVASLSAQERPTGGAVAVIDISKIFKAHTEFKQLLEAMKADVKEAETKLLSRRDSIQKLGRQLQQYQIGTQNYRNLEERIATEQSQLRLQLELQKKGFMEREAKVYYDVYAEIEKEVQQFARARGISLVLRYNSQPVNPQRRQEVLAGVNRAVVFQDRIDITQDILLRLQPPPHTRRGGTLPR